MLICFIFLTDQSSFQEEIILGGLLGRSSAKLPSSIRSGVNALKDTVQATKALQQLSNLSLTKRTCWSGSSAYTCGNSIPTNKQRQKNLDKPITSIDKSSSKELSTYQKRKKDRVANSTHCPDSVVKDVCETNDWPEKSVVDFSFCNQDKLDNRNANRPPNQSKNREKPECLHCRKKRRQLFIPKLKCSE